MDQAELKLPNDYLTVDGLDELFVESEPVAPPLQDGHATPPPGLTFKEACNIFGLKPTALRVRIKSGEIAAEKIEGVNGPEWRIYPTQPARHRFANITQPLREPQPDKLLLEMVQDLQIKLDAANHQLQAASFRNGYLESQVENHQSTIKLLTDSQQPRGWLHRLRLWLRGETGLNK